MVKDGTAKELATLRREKKAAIAKGRTKEQADYCNAIGVLLSNAGRLDEALEEHREELALCQALEDSIGEAVAHRRLGEVYCELGQLDEALSHHRLFLAAAERQQDRLELQRATATVGRTYLLQADNMSSSQGESKNELLSLANTYFERSLKVVPSVTGISDGERAEMMARLYLNIGIVAEAAGEPDRARTAYDKASSLTERHGLHEVGRRVHDALALSLQTAGDQEGALEHLRTSLRLAERTADPAARADALHGLAQAHLLMSNLDEASRTWYKAYRLRSPRQDEHKRHVRCLRYAVRLSRAADQLSELPADDHKTRHDLHERMGDWYCRLLAYRPALQHYQMQLECAEKLGSSESTKAAIYASLAETHRDLRQYDRAKHWFMKELDARQGNPTEVCKTLMNLASLETAMGGSVDSVCEWYRRAASEASLAGLARLRAAALRDLADTYAEHGRGEDEQRTRRDLALALRADHLPETDEGEDADSDAESSSSGGSELDAETLEGLQEESEEAEHPELHSRRPRRGGGTLWRNNKGETHLHVACIQGRLKQAERLLIGGHPVNARDHSGWLPLHEAANFGHAPLVELLIKHGAHVNDPGGRHCGGVTPLHDAAGNGHVAAARQLLAAGADPGAANENGQTPLQYLMHFMSQLDSGGESMSDLRELRQEMTDILRARGAPIPPSPSARLSQSASAQSGRSSPTLEDDSEETPLLPITISDDTEESPASAYRRAIRSVGQSAVNAPAPQAVLAARQQRQRTSDSPKSGLVSEDQYQWLEEDMPAAPRPRRRRRLSAVMAAAGGADRQRTMSPPPASGGVRPVSPLTGPDDDDSALHGRTQEIITSSPEDSRTPAAARQSQSAPGSAPGAGETPVDERRRPAKRQRMTTLEFEHQPQPSRVASRSPSPPAPPQRGSSSAAWSSGTLRVFVQVEADRLMVPVPLTEAGAAGRPPHTVQWLADRAADRYYQQFLLRPRLELLKDGALLAAEDAVQGLVSGQEDVLGSRVLGWERPPLAERYASVCAQLNQRPLRTVSARLALAQTSGRLELTELRLTPERLQPVLRAAERYGCVSHLLLAGNPLREPGARQLCAALPHLSGLQTLDLSGTQLSAAGLSRLATAAGQQQALRSCTTLLLGHNLFSADQCAGSLAELISALPRLASLDLTACQLTERHLRADDGALCRALAASQLTHLRLSHNEVRGRGAERLLSALRPDWLLALSLAGWRGVPAALGDYVARARDCCLQELDLRHSRITDDQAQLLASALTGCRHLARLDLSHNSGLSGRGVSGLLAAGCPLTRLSVAGCSATGPWLDPLLETSPDAPPLSLTVPAALLSGRAVGAEQVTPDGDVTLQLPVESAGRLTTAVG